jgi:nitrilase
MVLAGPDYTGETILYANIDPAAVICGKYDFDVVGHYARPDVFSLAVNVAARKAVTRLGEE